MEAQNAIRSARILLVTIKAMGNEIAKNLVLAGVDSLTISDLSPVAPEDLGAQFLLTEDDVGRNVSPQRKCDILMLTYPPKARRSSATQHTKAQPSRQMLHPRSRPVNRSRRAVRRPVHYRHRNGSARRRS